MIDKEKERKKLFGVLLAWRGLGEMPRDHLADLLIGFEMKYPINLYPIRSQEDYKNFLKTKERISHVELVIVKAGDEPVICVNPDNFYDEKYDGVWKNAKREKVYRANREEFRQQVFASIKNYWQERDTLKLLEVKKEGEKFVSFVNQLESLLQV